MATSVSFCGVSLTVEEKPYLECVIQVQHVILTCAKRIVFNLASDGVEMAADIVRPVRNAFDPKPFVLAVEGKFALAGLWQWLEYVILGT
jgi:hypothetical protein